MRRKKITFNGLAKLSWQNPKCGPSNYFFGKKFLRAVDSKVQAKADTNT